VKYLILFILVSVPFSIFGLVDSVGIDENTTYEQAMEMEDSLTPFIDVEKDREDSPINLPDEQDDYVTTKYQVEVECEKFPRSLKLRNGLKRGKYCINKTVGSRSSDVIYFFHGVFGFSWFWNFRGKYKEVARAMYGITQDVPIVITISYGQAHILTPLLRGHRRTGLLEKTMNVAIPYLEEKYEITGERYLLGDSMGGFNAATMYLNYPENFERAGFLCPALTKNSPFATKKQLKDFVKRTGAWKLLVYLTKIIGKKYFPTQQFWKNYSVLEYAKRYLSGHYPPMYLSAATRDQFGFTEGVRVLKELAIERDVDIEYHEVEGHHCELDPESIARFFLDR